MSDASPICRGKNLTMETVLAFVNAIPTESLPKEQFHKYGEQRLKGWKQTHSQIARQMALYYEDNNGVCHPRFTNRADIALILTYVWNWAHLYFVPNLYTLSLQKAEYKPTNIYAFIKNEILEGNTSFSDACDKMFGISLNNTDKVRVYLSNFSDIIINDDEMFLNENLADSKEYAVSPNINIQTTEEYFSYFSLPQEAIHEETDHLLRQTLQQICYGAPGTGKSHSVKCETKAWEKKGRVVRTTFHPDSDYSTFVGTYKPTTESVQRYDIYNKPMTRDGAPVMEQVITYEFVEQAFLQAYIDAWKNREEPEFLIIEEINRGNCAQIFGDLFQLLDRGDDGYSEYSIRADKDLQKHLSKAFKDIEIEDYPNVKVGKELLLPSNLYIRATMNTSDQSLFPIDSAFKRRWDWKYVPIAKGSDNGTELNWLIDVDGNQYDWWGFVKTINKHVFDTTNSEDKQLGFFFCKANNNIITAETFVCKVVFYLWNDVFKDFGFDNKIFEDKEDSVNPKLSFDKFYMANGKVDVAKIKMFLANLGIKSLIEYDENITKGDNDIIDSKIEIKVNGEKATYINSIPYMAVQEYVRLNPNKTAQEIIDVWSPFKNCSMRSWVVCNKQEHDTMASTYANYSYEITCADGESLWVNKDGWMHNPNKQRDTIAEFIKAVNEANLGITITETAI